VNGEGGTDTLIVNYSTLSADIARWDIGYGWNRIGDRDGLSHYTDFAGFERFDVTGGSGNDNFGGGDDNDILAGNAGNDWLNSGGGLGIDVVHGGIGSDTWQFDFSGFVSTSVNIATDNAVVSTGHTVTGIERLHGTFGIGNDTVVARAGGSSDSVWLGDGDDSFSSGRGRDYAHGGGGQDLLIMNGSGETRGITWADTGYGWQRYATAANQIDYYSFERFQIFGGTGDDDLRGGSLTDTLVGGAGNDTLRSGTGDAQINGGTGTDFWEADLSAEVASVAINLAASQTTAQGTAAGLNIRGIERVSLTTGAAGDNINAAGYAENDWVNLR
ncbi:calcium-binding protein, partial [Aphanothece microscopica]|uniref:calcium-binding protein n=1 Tax=Aphanothece microscopica TaxID=1049561 RepID=UPI003984B5CE